MIWAAIGLIVAFLVIEVVSLVVLFQMPKGDQ